MGSTLQISLLIDPSNNLVPGVNGVINLTNTLAPNVAQSFGILDKSVQYLTPSANMNIKLDGTHLAGREVTIANLSSTFIITVIANDASVIRTVYPNSVAQFVSTIDLPALNTNWVSLTPVESGWLLAALSLVGATNTSAFSNAAFANVQYRRSGHDVRVRGALSFSGVPAGGTGAFAVLMPASLPPDLNSVFASNVVGSADHKVAGVERGAAVVRAINNAGSPMLLSLMAVQFASSLSAGPFGVSAPAAFGSGDSITFDFVYPVSGWSVYKG